MIYPQILSVILSASIDSMAYKDMPVDLFVYFSWSLDIFFLLVFHKAKQNVFRFWMGSMMLSYNLYPFAFFIFEDC